MTTNESLPFSNLNIASLIKQEDADTDVEDEKSSTNLVQMKPLICSKDMVNPEVFNISYNNDVNSFKNVSSISDKSKELTKFLTSNLKIDLETITECLGILNPYLSKYPEPSYLNIIPVSSVLRPTITIKSEEEEPRRTSVPEKRKMSNDNDDDDFPHVKKNKSNGIFFEPKNSMPQPNFVSSNYFHSGNNFASNLKNNENTKIRNDPKVIHFPNTSSTIVSSKCVSQARKETVSSKVTPTVSNTKQLFSFNGYLDVSTELGDKDKHLPKNSDLTNPRLSENLNSKTDTVQIPNTSEKLRKEDAIEKIKMNVNDHNNYAENVSEDSSSAISVRNDTKTQLRTSSPSFRQLKNCVIKWQTSWLNWPISKTPPILDGTSEIKEVKNTYNSYEDYANTYLGLHLLNVWFNMQKSALSNVKSFPCKFHSTKDKNHNHQNVFRMTVEKKDMPVQQSLILLTYTRKRGNEQNLFGYIKKVEVRELKTSGKNKVFDALVTVSSHEKIKAPLKSHLSMKKLGTIRVASRQYEALIFGASEMKNIACQPDRNIHRFRTIRLSAFSNLEPYIDTIIQHIMSPEILLTVVCKPSVEDDSSLIIQRLACQILLVNLPVLICLNDEEKLFQIARKINFTSSLITIAVKENELNVPEDLRDHTLRGKAAKLHKKETEVIEKSKIMLTVLTHTFLGEAKKLPAKTVCLIVDAHLTSEAETALAMEMSPQSLLLYGAKEERREVDLPLQERNYNKTLFHRLLEFKNTMKIF